MDYEDMIALGHEKNTSLVDHYSVGLYTPTVAVKKPRTLSCKSVQDCQSEDSTESESDTDSKGDTDSGKNVIRSVVQDTNIQEINTSTQDSDAGSASKIDTSIQQKHHKDQDDDDDDNDEKENNQDNHWPEQVGNRYPANTDGYLCYYRC